MSRRSLQRKVWHSIYRQLPPIKRPGLEAVSWSEIIVSFSVFAFIVYLFVVK